MYFFFTYKREGKQISKICPETFKKENNMRTAQNKKYRYMMSGSFVPENKKVFPENCDPALLGIDIPAPYNRDSEKEAMQDSHFSYRFGVRDGEVVILVYPREEWEPAEDKEGRKYLHTWTVGEPVTYYKYKKFKELGGLIFAYPNGAICKAITLEELNKWHEETKDFSWNAEDYVIEADFNKLFPSLTEEEKPVYIDNEAYFIKEEYINIRR